MIGRTLRRAATAGVLALVTGLIGSVAVGALPASATTAAPDAMIRGAHFSPDTPGVDVYLTAFAGGTTTLWLSDVGYGDVSPYRLFPSGLYAVSMRPHGAPSSTPAALSWTLNARPGQAYTAAAVGMNSKLHGIILDDQLNQPPAGQGLIRVIEAASRAPKARVAAVGGPVITPSAAFATATGYTSVPAGDWTIRATSLSAPSVTATAPVDVASGTVDSIVVLDGKQDGITLRTVVDAAGAAAVPAGPVPAGGGGTAARPGAGWAGEAGLVGGAALALVACCGCVLAGRRRWLRSR